jgi:unsaturated rhamnogalacturonyl hydrolase
MKLKHIFLSLITPFAIQACKANDQTTNKSNIVLADTETAMVKALAWQEAHPIARLSPKDWTNGAYYIGVTKAYEATKNPVFLNALTGMAKRNNWETDGRIRNADDLAVGYSYLYLKSIKAKDANISPTVDYINQHLAVKKTADAALWYWADALFMGPPAITKLAKMNNDQAMLDDMYDQYKKSYETLYDKEAHLFARDGKYVWKDAATDIKEKNGKKVFWARGNGWVLGSLALVLNDMPKDYKNRPFFINLFKELATKIKDLQQPDGLWTAGLLDPQSYGHGETSGSGLFTFGIAWGINNGILNKADFKPVIDKSWSALLATQKEDGMIGYVQGVGAAPGPSNADSWYNYGTGAFLLAGSEILKMK